MTYPASNIPLLYCLLYYRAGPQIRQTDQTLSAQFDLSDLKHDGSIVQPGSLGKTTYKNIDRTSDERKWLYHNRVGDLNKLCSHVYDFNSYRTDGHADVPRDCSVKNRNDIRVILSESFTSEYDLRDIILRLDVAEISERHGRSNVRPLTRYTVQHPASETIRNGVLWAGQHGGGIQCGTCLTEIGYEVLTEVTDFNGDNHTVINFHNAYQFISSGRCLNENYPCSVNNARCKQIYRAHWTLVWSGLVGVQLVAHEVPSHCECVNIGGSYSQGT